MSFNVYSYGMVSASTLFVLDGKFPEPDMYAEIKESYRMLGGEAANSSIVISKLGGRVKLDGNWLGADEKGKSVIRILKDFHPEYSTVRAWKKSAGCRAINKHLSLSG